MSQSLPPALRLPFVRARAACRLRRPLDLSEGGIQRAIQIHEALYRRWKTTLYRRLCLGARGDRACEWPRDSRGPRCIAPAACVASWVLAPRSEAYCRDLPLLAWVRLPGLLPRAGGVRDLDLEVLLLGERAGGLAGLLPSLLPALGAPSQGYRDAGVPSFDVGEVTLTRSRPLGEGRFVDHGLVQMATSVPVAGPTGSVVDLAGHVGNLAYDLTLLARVEAGVAPSGGYRDAECSAARDEVANRFLSLDVRAGHVQPMLRHEVDGGLRSGGNRRPFGGALADFDVLLEGDLRALGPWLIAARRIGLGQHRAHGLGQVSVRFATRRNEWSSSAQP